ncbi:hypothetical protein GEMRC1_004141 [Eukaryota sp. GEM-RC1]
MSRLLYTSDNFQPPRGTHPKVFETTTNLSRHLETSHNKSTPLLHSSTPTALTNSTVPKSTGSYSTDLPPSSGFVGDFKAFSTTTANEKVHQLKARLKIKHDNNISTFVTSVNSIHSNFSSLTSQACSELSTRFNQLDSALKDQLDYFKNHFVESAFSDLLSQFSTRREIITLFNHKLTDFDSDRHQAIINQTKSSLLSLADVGFKPPEAIELELQPAIDDLNSTLLKNKSDINQIIQNLKNSVETRETEVSSELDSIKESWLLNCTGVLMTNFQKLSESDDILRSTKRLEVFMKSIKFETSQSGKKFVLLQQLFDCSPTEFTTDFYQQIHQELQNILNLTREEHGNFVELIKSVHSEILNELGEQLGQNLNYLKSIGTPDSEISKVDDHGKKCVAASEETFIKFTENISNFYSSMDDEANKQVDYYLSFFGKISNNLNKFNSNLTQLLSCFTSSLSLILADSTSTLGEFETEYLNILQEIAVAPSELELERLYSDGKTVIQMIGQSLTDFGKLLVDQSGNQEDLMKSFLRTIS